jgi:hypothetical protein
MRACSVLFGRERGGKPAKDRQTIPIPEQKTDSGVFPTRLSKVLLFEPGKKDLNRMSQRTRKGKEEDPKDLTFAAFATFCSNPDCQ